MMWRMCVCGYTLTVSTSQDWHGGKLYVAYRGFTLTECLASRQTELKGQLIEERHQADEGSCLSGIYS